MPRISPSYQLPIDFLVSKEATKYVVRNHAGVAKYRSSYEELAIKEALDSLTSGRTWREKVLLKGDFPDLAYLSGNTGCIDVPSHTELELIGRVKLADSVNKAIIANKERTGYTTNVWVHGGELDGNYTNQTSGHGIDWYYAIEPPSGLDLVRGTKIEDIRIFNIKNDGIHAETLATVYAAGGMRMDGVGLRTVGGYGIYWKGIKDSGIANCAPLEGYPYSFYAEGTGCCSLLGSYINKGLVFVGGTKFRLADCFIDIEADTHGITVGGLKYSTFSNLIIRVIGNGATTNDAIRLQAGAGVNATGNIFSIITGGRHGTTGTRRWNYIIQEADANQDYNVHDAIIGDDYVTACLRKLGVNSKHDANSIIGTVVTT